MGGFWGAWMMRDPAAARALHGELLTWIRDGKLKPHIHARYALDEAPRALRELLERKVQGKSVLMV